MTPLESPKVDCPRCHAPAQWAGMPCGFCSWTVPMPKGAVAIDGTLAQTDEVLGFRAWSINRENARREPILESPVIGRYLWRPGQWLDAECASGRGTLPPTSAEYHGSLAPSTRGDDDRQSPVKDCCCGFYAGKTRAHLIGMGYGRYTGDNPTVVGVVQMSGKIIPASNGYRAQKVRPRKIFVPYEFWELANELIVTYGPFGVEVECNATNMLDKATAPDWCEKCTAKMGRSPVCDFCGHHHQ